jgi:hypothetical protein
MCHYDERRYDERRYDERCYDERRYAECRYAECRGTLPSSFNDWANAIFTLPNICQQKCQQKRQ